MSVDDICREHGIGKSIYYKWKAKFSGMEAAKLKRMHDLEAENARLK